MEPEKKSNGAFVGLVIIIIILVIGGIYIWQSNKINMELQNDLNESRTITNQDAMALDALELDSKTTDTNTGVEVDAVN